MGELTKKSNISLWLDRIDATRSELILSAKSGNRVAAAFAMADARCELIESLSDETIRAKLLRMTSPEAAMVELVNKPTDEDRIRVCAIGILSGFTPGDEQFSVFGSGFDKQAGTARPGKLYVKERGFRTLFSHLGIVPEVHTGHPEFLPFGSAGKKAWMVSGKASCTYIGKEYVVEQSGEHAIGIPGYESDNVAGIAAKARRRLLQSLWVMVSPILSTDQYDDDQDAIPLSEQSSPRLVEAVASEPMQTQDPTAEPSKAYKFEQTWYAELKGINGAAKDLATKIKTAWKAGDIETLGKIALEDVPAIVDTKHRENLRRYVDAAGQFVQDATIHG